MFDCRYSKFYGGGSGSFIFLFRLNAYEYVWRIVIACIWNDWKTSAHLAFEFYLPIDNIHIELDTQHDYNTNAITSLSCFFIIFKKTNIICLSLFTEPRCGPVTGAPISLPIPCDVDPQPLVDRRSSISLLKWGSCKRNDAPTPTAARQGLNDCKIIFN